MTLKELIAEIYRKGDTPCGWDEGLDKQIMGVALAAPDFGWTEEELDDVWKSAKLIAKQSMVGAYLAGIHDMIQDRPVRQLMLAMMDQREDQK